MKHIYTLSIISACLLSYNLVFSQNLPFAVKVKQVKGAHLISSSPAPIIGGHPAMFNQNVAFKPRQLLYPGNTPDINIFTKTAFSNTGQLIFAEGMVEGITTINSNTDKAVTNASNAYLQAISSYLHIEDPSTEFALKGIATDELSMTHYKLTQVYKGIPVYGSEIYLHAKNGLISVFNGNSFPTPDISTAPLYSAEQALSATKNDIASHTVLRDLSKAEAKFLEYNGPVTELVIYHKDRNSFNAQLAWHISIRPNLIERWEYFISATDGKIIHYFNNTQSDGDIVTTGTDLNGVSRNFHSYLEKGTYYLFDISRAMYNSKNNEGVIATYDASNTSPNGNLSATILSSSNNKWDAKAVSVQYFATATYEYYRTVHGLNSINNQGCSIPMIVNVSNENGTSMENAFWNGKAAFFGNGGSTYKPLAGGFDVIAHELGHAVIGSSANLEYEGQSGALNESFADISGCMLDRNDWKVGEDVVKPGAPGFPSGAIRDMSNPHNGGSGNNSPCWQPANLSEIYTGTADNGGVHINSGIPNYAFYLFANQVSREKAEKVYYRALFNYLTRSSQFIDARLAVIQSAKDLYGDNSQEMNAAVSAFDNVGISDGTATNKETPIPVNPGQDYILYANSSPQGSNQIYISNTDGSSTKSVSGTVIANKPSIVDDGSYAIFIANDKKMHGVDFSSGYNESVIQNEAIWGNAAISKDGNLLAGVTNDQDSSIWVYSYELQQWAKFHLYNPGTQIGVTTDNVLYADALEWTYDGEYIMYDAYNVIKSNTASQIQYWDVSFIKVWDKAAHKWAGGEILKMFTNLPKDISIGNPSFSKRSPQIAAFDMVNDVDNSVNILAANLETGEVSAVYANGGTLGYPNYSKNDDKLIFNALDNSGNKVIGIIGMQTNKISPLGNASLLIPSAHWGIWFAKGSRPLSDELESSNKITQILPNPTNGIIRLNLAECNAKDGSIEIINSSGIVLKTVNYRSDQPWEQIDLSKLSPGLYLVKILNGNKIKVGKILKN